MLIHPQNVKYSKIWFSFVLELQILSWDMERDRKTDRWEIYKGVANSAAMTSETAMTAHDVEWAVSYGQPRSCMVTVQIVESSPLFYEIVKVFFWGL